MYKFVSYYRLNMILFLENTPVFTSEDLILSRRVVNNFDWK